MNYGLYLSASGVLTSMYRQDVFANNLANATTVGFRRDVPSVRQRSAEATSNPAGAPFRQVLLDKLGGGVWAGPQRMSLEPGPLNPTGGALDVALTKGNSFFAVGVADPTSGAQQVRLTRDGRFTRNAQGQLVTVAGGNPVLDPDDRPITLSGAGTATITRDGQVLQNGQVVGRIQVSAVADPSQLRKEGQNLLRIEGDPKQRRAVADPGLQSGHVEASDVDPIRALLDLTTATQDVTANSNLIKYHDLLMDRAVNVLGRVA